MATSANMFIASSTGGSTQGYIAPDYWNKVIEQYAKRAIIMQPLGITDTTLMGGDGKQINIAKNIELEVASLTEGIATPVTSLAYGQVTVTVGEYGQGVQISKLQLKYSFESTMNDVMMNLGYAMAKKKDTVIFDACTSGAYQSLYDGSITSGTITSGDTFNTDLIAKGIRSSRVLNRPAMYLVINPVQEESLLKNSQFVNASEYGGREVVLNGEIGRYLGVRILSSNVVTAVTENSTTVYQALLFGPRPFVVAEKWMPDMKVAEDSVLDRAITIAVDAAYGVSVLNSESIQILKSA